MGNSHKKGFGDIIRPVMEIEEDGLSLFRAKDNTFWSAIGEMNVLNNKKTIFLHEIFYTCCLKPVVDAMRTKDKTKKIIIAAAKVMVGSVKEEMTAIYGRSCVAIEKTSGIADAFDAEVVVISDRLLKEVPKAELKKAQVLWLYHPTHFGLHTKTFAGIKEQLNAASKAVVMVDSLHYLAGSDYILSNLSTTADNRDGVRGMIMGILAKAFR